jgi:hypothetical protein
MALQVSAGELVFWLGWLCLVAWLWDFECWALQWAYLWAFVLLVYRWLVLKLLDVEWRTYQRAFALLVHW